MASDLSELIQNGLSGTLESLLAKTSTLDITNKAHPSDLKSQCVKVNAKFEFENITSIWSFFVPALGASHIFNLMMGEEIEPSEEIDDDTVDALNEVVSNICGGLSTAINGSGFEDLGSVKFSLDGNEMVDGTEYATTDNLFKFIINIEERPIDIFIAFDDVIMEFIETIASSPITEVKEDEPQEEGTEAEQPEENKEEETESSEEENKEDKDNEVDDENSKEENKEEAEGIVEDTKKSKFAFLEKLNFLKVDETLSEEEQKQTKLKKIIILVSIIFALVIIVGAVLFFTGAFDPNSSPDENSTSTDINSSIAPKQKKATIKTKVRKKQINFKTSQINIKRLNKRLSLLTKYEILEEDAIEQIKAKDRERLYREKQKRLEDFAGNNKEEAIFTKVTSKNGEIDRKSRYSVDGINTNKTNISDNNQVEVKGLYIQIPTLKLKQFRHLIKQAKKVSASLSICKDLNERTQIFIGPFISDKSRTKTLKNISSKLLNQTKKIELTKVEFNNSCNF